MGDDLRERGEAVADKHLRCACRGSRRLDCRVIDGTDGWITCPWCLAAPSSSEGVGDG